MIRTTLLTTALFAAFGSVWLGCSAQKDATPTAAQPSAQAETGTVLGSDNPDLASLSEEDRQLVLAQKVCPVSGEALGSMGTPIKITVDGRHLFICCKSCEDSAKEKFDEYYANLEKAATSKQAN
jgi:hypothetical protein